MKLILIPVNPRGPALTIGGDAHRLTINRATSDERPAAEIVLNEHEVKSLRRALRQLDVEEEARQCPRPR